ncbi:MFS transporter [Patescibacteria group bacterium]
MKKNNILKVIYFTGFLIALQSALPAYINSTFLNLFIPEKFVGLLYTLGSILTIVILIYASELLTKFGNYKSTITTILIYLISFIFLVFSNSPQIIAIAFIVNFTMMMIIGFNIDIFLENFSDDSKTGKIRGFYLTSINIAWVISPMIAGYLLTNGDYWKIYSISAILTLPILILIIPNFKKFADPDYKKIPILNTLKEVWENKNIYNVVCASLLLRFFYSWMVIYTPIYLHNTMGFEWSIIGTIFTIMLLPFILLEIPLGTLADKFLGEKEMLTLGFIIISISTLSLSFLETKNFLIWAVILFCTRVGASMIEIMTESYFFKNIDAKDTDILSFFRMTRPLAYAIAPLIASAFLIFLDFKYIFLILGIITLYGLRYSLTIKDTK